MCSPRAGRHGPVLKLIRRRSAVADKDYRNLLRRNSGFRRLWLARLVSLTGDRASAVALLGLVLGRDGSGFLAGVILAANMLSPLMVFPVVATILDRFSRKAVMVVASVASAIMALAMVLVTSTASIWVGIVATLGIAIMNAFHTPASQAALPNLVDPEDLGSANTLLASIQGIALGVGPIVGGLLSAYLARDVVFVTNALSFLLSAWLIAGIRRSFAAERQDPMRSPHAIREGLAYVGSDARLRSLLGIKSLFALAGGGCFVLLPIFAVDAFGMGDLGLGLLMAARGLGALLGPIVARACISDCEGRLFATIGACGALFGAAYTLFAIAPTIILGLPLVVVAHSGGFALWTMQAYGLQMRSVDQYRGRLFALDFTLGNALMGASMLITGQLTTSISPRLLMASEGAAVFVCAVVWALVTRQFWRSGPGPHPTDNLTPASVI